MHSRISVIIPLLNEQGRPGALVGQLWPLLREGDELIFVDGGSTDNTWPELLGLAQRAKGVKVVQSPRGRAVQMNRGAAMAQGDCLLFLHADTQLPHEAWLLLVQTAEQQRYLGPFWGRFDVRISGRSLWLPVVACLMNWRSRWSKVCTGDQAMFMSRSAFDLVNGFPAQPLMEDIAISKRLRKLAGAGFLALPCAVETSGRRWDEHGAPRTIVLMWRLRLFYFLGVPAHRLADQYRFRTHSGHALGVHRNGAKTLVALFAKFPQAGRTKTRLAPVLGEEGAARFAAHLLKRMLSQLQAWQGDQESPFDVALWVDGGSTEEWAQLLGADTLSRVRILRQPLAHLGHRMSCAVQYHLAQYEQVVLLGPDAVQFGQADLHAMQRAAYKADFVFVPAHDGGYVAVSCKRLEPAMFSGNIDWGGPQVAEQTRLALGLTGSTQEWLPVQHDLDEPEDLQLAIAQGWVSPQWDKS